jgi:hypothetical protein
MLETAEQIQTPVLPECPVLEITLQSPVPEAPQPGSPSQDENILCAEIEQLWQVHNDYKTSIKHESQSLRALRVELGKKLAEMKQVLAKPGRGGQWSSWLKERKIPRATADRLVSKYECSLNPDGNCLTESISEPTEAEIQSLLDKIASRLRRVLRTRNSVYRFVDLVASSFALERQEAEVGLVIVKPFQETAVAEHVPAEVTVEPVSPIGDVVEQANSDPI